MADRDQARAERVEARREDRLEHEQAAFDRAGAAPERAPMVHEVMADTFGANPTFIKGDLLTAAEIKAAGYDLDWGLKMGHLREAPEYVGRGLRSTTQPIEGQPESLTPAPEA